MAQQEKFIYQARLHWVIFIWPVAFALFGVWFGLHMPALQQISLFLVGAGVVWFFLMWLTYHFSSLTIKKKQVILRKGILVRQTMDIPMTKIESIDIKQSIIGTLFQYGSLVITGTGGTQQWMTYVSKPLTCRRYVEELMYDNT
tara:strand:- start:18 stop:449 length:432 start_codon:yes stop_codon:yes gene_type:complete